MTAKSTKQDHLAIVHRLWRGGERSRAVAYADENRVDESKWPDGMAAYAAVLRRKR